MGNNNNKNVKLSNNSHAYRWSICQRLYETIYIWYGGPK